MKRTCTRSACTIAPRPPTTSSATASACRCWRIRRSRSRVRPRTWARSNSASRSRRLCSASRLTLTATACISLGPRTGIRASRSPAASRRRTSRSAVSGGTTCRTVSQASATRHTAASTVLATSSHTPSRRSWSARRNASSICRSTSAVTSALWSLKAASWAREAVYWALAVARVTLPASHGDGVPGVPALRGGVGLAHQRAGAGLLSARGPRPLERRRVAGPPSCAGRSAACGHR